MVVGTPGDAGSIADPEKYFLLRTEARAVHPGLQPGQFSAKDGLAGVDEALDPDESTNQADQDWRAVGTPCQEAGIPAC